MNKPLYVNGLCLWFVREIEKIDVVGLCRFQSSLPPGFVTDVAGNCFHWLGNRLNSHLASASACLKKLQSPAINFPRRYVCAALWAKTR